MRTLRSHHNTEATLPSKQYRFLSWNILGPAYLDSRIHALQQQQSSNETNNAASSTKTYLDWSYRSHRIATMLLEANADILCLQEVPMDHCQQDSFLELLRDAYTVIVQNVTEGHPYGCATLVRQEWRVVHAASRSRALWIQVELDQHHQHDTNTTTLLTIANVHLMAGRGQELTRWYQLRSLLQHCCGTPRHGNSTTTMMILAGDCNILPAYSPIHAWLTTGIWNVTKAASLEYGIQPFAQVHDKVRGQVQRVATPPYPWRYIDPCAFLDRTYTTGGILDSIWISAAASAVMARPWCVRPPPSIPSSWPSRDHPSDHWMVGMEFSVDAADAEKEEGAM